MHKVTLRRRKLKTERNYYAYWRDDNGRQHARAVGPDRKLAEVQRETIEQEINADGYRILKPISLADFAVEHLGLVATELSPASVQEHRSTLRRLQEFSDEIGLARISHAHIERFRAHLVDDALSPYTTNKIMRTLDGIFNRAIQRGYLKLNPCAKLKKLREPERQLRHLSPEEVERIFTACPNDRWRAFVYFCATTGCRKGEAQYLRWGDLDMECGIAHIVNHDDHYTKSRRQRDVILVPTAVELLRRIMPHGAIPAPDSWVFLNQAGRPMLYNTNRVLRSILRRAGVAHCTFHDLRRTITQYMEPRAAQTLLGHARMETTQRYYQGPATPEMLARELKKVPWTQPKSEVKTA